MNGRAIAIDPLDHPALRAWVRLSGERRRPGAIERLQKKKKGKVYRLRCAGPASTDIVAKHSSRARIEHERTIYERVLPSLPVPAVRYHGCVEDADGSSWWLFLDDVGGEAYSACRESHRVMAGQWLGTLHTSGATSTAASRLPDRGPDFYYGHLLSAHRMILRGLGHRLLAQSDVDVLAAIVEHCEVVASHWREVIRFCDESPRTFIHGDFAPKNMRVLAGANGLALIPFDWGSAGWGTPAADLAQHDPSGAGWSDWASPNLTAYWSITHGLWSRLDMTDLRHVAVIGQIFRCVVCVSLSAQSLATDWVERAARNMPIYERELANAIRAAGWGRDAV